MAVMELWRRRDLEGTVKTEYVDGNFFTQDSVGNLVGVKCYKDGAEVSLTGSVTGYCVLPSGETVSVAGTRSGNQASILVPQSALAFTGPLGITIKLVDGNTITTLMSIIVVVYRSKTDTVITPSSQVITDWSQQISAALQEVEDASAAQDQKIADLKSALSNTKTKSGKIIYIDDALADTAPVSISGNGQIFGKNFGKLNASSYTGNGITFTVDSNDPNTITVVGTATANAYSYATITAENARIKVPAGTYYMKAFSDTDIISQEINLYVNDVTKNTVAYVGLANAATVITFEQETVLGVRVQVPQGFTVNARLSVYFGMVETETYELYSDASDTMHRCSTVLFETSGSITYCAHIRDYLNSLETTDDEEIFDAIAGIAAYSIPSSAIVYSRNMYRTLLANRITNGITFRQDASDLNSVFVSGTANSNAYSFGTVTERSAIMLEAGTYYIAYYSDSYTDTTDKLYWVRLDLIPESTGVKASRDIRDHCYKLVLTERTWVGVRLRVREGITVNDYVHLYFSKYPPLPVYCKYAVPNHQMKQYAVVERLVGESISYYKRENNNVDPVNIKFATFNVGDFSNGVRSETTPTSMDAYIKYIASLDADVLCTQEDRLVYDPNTDVKIFDIFYKYLYRDSETESYSTSIDAHTGSKRISSNFELSPSGRYTFSTQGTTEEGTSMWSSFTWSGLLIGNRYILLIDAHLAPKEWNTAARKAQITEILDFVSACGVSNVIICGDFNVWEDELDLFTNAGYELANGGLYGSIPTFYVNDHPFDNIAVKSDYIKMRDVKAVSNDLNDHYALTATLTVI